MKKMTLITLVLLLVSGNLFAQQEKGITGYNNWLNSWTEFKPSTLEYEKPTQIISGNITSDTKLRKRDIYLLLGDVVVTDSTTLTIEPGTVILGDFKTKASLTINSGSKLLAKGTRTDPIIFTSNKSVKKPGDWGGIFILGDAPTSQFGEVVPLDYGLKTSGKISLGYGGSNTNSNSGVLEYVRIEFAGKRTRDYGYFNALTLAGVGKQTIINNVMVSYCKGNSFNILGGDIIVDKLVSYKSHINDYAFNYGAQCKITNSLAVKSPYISGAGTSRCIYASGYDVKEEADFNKKQTFVTASNLTLINISNDLEQDLRVGLVNEAIYVGDNVSFSIDRSVISGFNPAVVLDRSILLNDDNLSKIRFSKTYFNNCNGNIFQEGKTNNDDLENWYGNNVFNNVYSKGPDSETFINSKSTKRPDFRLQINRIIASNDDDD